MMRDARFKRALVGAIEDLPEREKHLMGMYYEQDMNFREIAEVLGVTESRVCQLHTQAGGVSAVADQAQALVVGRLGASSIRQRRRACTVQPFLRSRATPAMTAGAAPEKQSIRLIATLKFRVVVNCLGDDDGLDGLDDVVRDAGRQPRHGTRLAQCAGRGRRARGRPCGNAPANASAGARRFCRDARCSAFAQSRSRARTHAVDAWTDAGFRSDRREPMCAARCWPPCHLRSPAPMFPGPRRTAISGAWWKRGRRRRPRRSVCTSTTTRPWRSPRPSATAPPDHRRRLGRRARLSDELLGGLSGTGHHELIAIDQNGAIFMHPDRVRIDDNVAADPELGDIYRRWIRDGAIAAGAGASRFDQRDVIAYAGVPEANWLVSCARRPDSRLRPSMPRARPRGRSASSPPWGRR